MSNHPDEPVPPQDHAQELYEAEQARMAQVDGYTRRMRLMFGAALESLQNADDAAAERNTMAALRHMLMASFWIDEAHKRALDLIESEGRNA